MEESGVSCGAREVEQLQEDYMNLKLSTLVGSVVDLLRRSWVALHT
jgi:hypothetical protein